ncbi:MAG TPA: 50S ribosomal protein L3 [Candidatus Nanoarchaeia archaeon]|nr:50S ribosomal protein L3 [Candidatus Nanoarchaeia archaeon]
MAPPKRPRKGSLQVWPRKRASKFLPSVNWDAIDSGKSLKGFITYKAGMTSVHAKDKTPDSMTKDKKIVFPVTILECPPMKILSIRFYKHGKVMDELVSDNLDKYLKRVIKLPKTKIKKIEDIKEYDDVRLIVYSEVKKTNIKKTPDLTEIGLTGSVEEKINFAKSHLNKELTMGEFFDRGQLVDLRGLSKGKGFQGPVKRFGVTLRSHKAEKGVRKVGSVGPWHPARTTFRTPMAGQLGMFTRLQYNSHIVHFGKADLKNLKNFGDIKTDYVLVQGSVQGPVKRQVLITSPLRKTKKQDKRNYEFIEVLR